MSTEVATPEKPLFTAKEQEVLNVAWTCLKSGVPDIDIKRLTSAAGFKTEKTASNTWGTIKRKLLTLIPEGTEGWTPINGKSTPNTATASSKKRGKKASEDDTEDTPTKKRGRKSPLKKEVKAEDADVKMEDDQDAEGSDA